VFREAGSIKERGPLRRLIPHLPVVLAFGLLTAWVTYPLWLHPATCLPVGGDASLNAYILAWGQYALLHRIGDFFGANYFWPNDAPLAYGELMLTQAVLALPARLATTAPAALFNVAFVEGIFFSALAAYALGWHYFRSRGAAWVVGMIYGFAACRLARTNHIQLTHGEGLPLMFLGLEWIMGASGAGGGERGDRDDRRRRRQGQWLLCGAALAQWLASWYWTIFSFWAFVPFAAARLWMERRRGQNLRRALAVAAPLALAGCLAAPWALPYLDLRRRFLLTRPEIVTLDYSARLGDWLLPSANSLLWGWAWRSPTLTGVDAERYLFPGLLAAAIPALALATWAWDRRRRTGRQANAASAQPASPSPAFSPILWLGLTALLASFCFGPRVTLDLPGGGHVGLPTLYALLGKVIPMNDQIRVPARWILPAMLGPAMLGGWLWRRWRGTGAGLSRGRRALGWTVAAALVAESLTRPIPVTTVPNRPSALAVWLEARPWPSPTLLLPDNDPLAMFKAAFHRQPLVNGSNGYFPPLYRVRMDELARFPAADVLDALVAMHVRYVAIDARAMAAPGPNEAPDGVPGVDWVKTLARARASQPDVIRGYFRLDDPGSGAAWWIVELPAPPLDRAPTIPDIGQARMPKG
jgi:hypothetical protein